MTESDWKNSLHFKKTENWGDPEKMSSIIVSELDAFRGWIKKPFVVTCGTQGKHSKNSTHYLGLAVDFIVPELEPKDMPDLFIEAARFRFCGIGIYPHWVYNGKVVGGMHVDCRRARVKQHWIGLPDGSYVNLNMENIKKYFI